MDFFIRLEIEVYVSTCNNLVSHTHGYMFEGHVISNSAEVLEDMGTTASAYSLLGNEVSHWLVNTGTKSKY